MAGDPRVLALLEEMLETDRTPEEVCHDHPELLTEVRRRWRDFRLIDQEVSAFLPPSLHADARPPKPDPAELPEVPGYRVEAVVGQGGMGIVYKAWHLRLQRHVALKMLLAGAYAKAAERERFQREAEAIAALVHPNIVQVHDVGEVDERPYFTMELVAGGDLAKHIQGIPQPARKAAGLVATLADAVQAAHQRGIVHRDLKPANVLLTSDGTPKVTDFGLAQRLEGGEGLTLTGTPLGTPSYMAPEQARGNRVEIGPATDIYALGAILYELLTGRPPFRADSGLATLQQVMADDPVPPARLNRRVPRDLETICLKCLHKEPQRRYASAQALAEDLRRFERGEPIKARPVGAMERAMRWARRRPSLAGALSAGVILALALVVTVAWWHGQRTALEATAVAYAEADLRESERLRDSGEFRASDAVLRRAKDRLGEFVPPQMRDRLATAFANLELVTRLDEIRLDRDSSVDGRFATAEIVHRYEEAFRGAGLGDPQDDPGMVAARVRSSAVRRALIEALDDWALCTTDDAQRKWCLDVARRAEGDPDPNGWGNRLRDPNVWQDQAALNEISRTIPTTGPSVTLLVAAAQRLHDLGGNPLPVLKRVQQAHPGDFGAAYTLGVVLLNRDPKEAAGYLRAALALRPNSWSAYERLVLALIASGNVTEASEYVAKLKERAPKPAGAHVNLGLALKGLGRLDEAVVELQKALELDPANATAHNNLGNILDDRGDPDGAMGHYLAALRSNPRLAFPHYNLGIILQNKRRLDEAIEHYRAAVRIEPGLPDFHFHLARALQTRGQWEVATKHFQKAVELDPNKFAARLNLGQTLRDQGRLDAAVEQFQKAVEIDPKQGRAHGGLADSLFAAGRFTESRAAFRRALELLPANDPLRSHISQQVQRCDEMLKLEGRLAEVIGSTVEPASVNERVQFAELCHIKKHYRKAAQLYTAAFAADPLLAADPLNIQRYTAARAAARAGCGDDANWAEPSETERARWRKQTLDWLRADLTVWSTKLEGGIASDRALATRMLLVWRNDVDLAGLRDADAVEKLPPLERRECLTLWSDVDALLGKARLAR